jgi:hypothetical protein
LLQTWITTYQFGNHDRKVVHLQRDGELVKIVLIISQKKLLHILHEKDSIGMQAWNSGLELPRMGLVARKNGHGARVDPIGFQIIFGVPTTII